VLLIYFCHLRIHSHYAFFFADKPENVTLTPSNSSVCSGSMVEFTCIADANPPVLTYKLFEGGGMIENFDGSGETRAFNTSGQFNHRCEASNSEGTGTSSDSVLTVGGELA